MTKTCVKCGHVRRETDRGPDYACPSCGIVYAKAEAAKAEIEAAAQARSEAAAAARARAAMLSETPAAAPKGIAPGKEALIQQLMVAQSGQHRGPSPYRGVALIALVAFALGFGGAAALYGGASKMGKAAAKAAVSCPK